jgi:hypothetical protein
MAEVRRIFSTPPAIEKMAEREREQAGIARSKVTIEAGFAYPRKGGLVMGRTQAIVPRSGNGAQPILMDTNPVAAYSATI